MSSARGVLHCTAMKNPTAASNVNNANHAFVQRSLASVWHPCTQMKHHEQFPLVPIVRGEGAYLIDAEGKRILDAVSSWWVNLFGHANAHINAALKAQLDTLEHAMLAGFTHEPAIELAEQLAKLTGLGHAFYASDGASAVEIALKMSFHSWKNCGQPQKKKFVSLNGSYHGETLGALAVTDVAIFRDAYGPLLQNNIVLDFPQGIAKTPVSTGISKANDPNSPPIGEFGACCAACVDAGIAELDQLLSQRHHEIAALIVEPLVQGAAGMRMYHPAFLQAARRLCTHYGVHLIADEIMTGFGRTGAMFAVEHAGIKPDLMCLSKGITGGYLPLSCVLSTDEIYATFYDDDTARGFLHSHSYTGSALACRAALATLEIFARDDVIASNHRYAARFNQLAAPLAAHPRVKNFRHLGMIWAFDVESSAPAFSRAFFSAALARGALLRPIGHTVYFMPPYILRDEEFAMLVESTVKVIDALR
jgi:adenosylmethionine---8-amino-7-oxononanoate aminotransferase